MLAAVEAEFERRDKGPLSTDHVGVGVGAADVGGRASGSGGGGAAMSEEAYLTHLMRQEQGVWASCDQRLHGVVDNVFGSYSNPTPNPNLQPTPTPTPNQVFGSFFFAWLHPAGLRHVQETKRTSAFKVRRLLLYPWRRTTN